MDSREKHNLRKRAEELKKLYDSDNSSSIREGDALKLLHELEVHQIELELSNDELILARDQAETLTNKYTVLYDFAPMGYLTIDREGTISELNFSAAKMLGSDRSLLAGRDFKTFIDINELPSFSAFLIQVFYLKTKQICELKLKSTDPNARAYSRLEGIIDADGNCMIAMVDISLSKQHENDLKEAHRRAKESEKYLTNILNKIGDPLFVKDEQSRLLLVNDSFCKLFGVSKKNILGKTLAEDVSLEEKEHFLRIDKQVLANGRQSILEESLTLQDQETQIISTKKNRYIDDEGKKFLIGTIRDITGQKQTADKLKRSTQLLEASQAIARLGGWELDLKSGDLFWTAETYRIHDTSPEEFNPTVAAGVGYFLPESRRIITEALRAATEEGKGYDLELETYTTKGRLISVRTTCNVEIMDGKPVKLVGIFQDITERQQFEKALQNSEERFRNAITYAPYPIMIHADGNVVQLSDEWIRQTGYTPKDIPTIKKWSSLAYGKDAIPSNEFIEKLYNIEKPQSDGEWKVKIKDGSYVLWSFSSSPIGKLPNGKKMVISMATDITEIKKYREHLEELVTARTADLELRTAQLQKANEGLLHAESEMHRAYDMEKELGELKSRFVSTASHQFRTPLTVIQSNVELMEMSLDSLEGSLRARFEKSFERINKESHRMTALMDDVLILGKINANAVVIHPEWLDVITITRDLIQRLNEVDKLSAKIQFEMSGDPREIFVDKNQYSHILLNILSNAQKYTIDQSDITFQLVFDNKQLKITIEDQGIGMSQEDLKTVFQPFTRGRNTEGIHGTGLGMSIVQEYVSLNNGKIKIDSELNVGTTVTLTFTDHE